MTRLDPPSCESTATSSLLAAAAACAPDAVVTVDDHGRLTSWNSAAEQLLGWPADQVVGRPASMLVPGDRSKEAELLDGGPAALEHADTLLTERLHASGERVAVSLRRAPLVVDGRRVGTVAVMRGFAAELAARRELQQVRRLAELRFEQSVLALVSLSPDGTIQQVNAALCRLSGYAAEELLGRSYADFLLPSQAQHAAANQARVISGTLSMTREQRMLRKADGTYLETIVSLSALRDDAGAVVGLEVAIDDISAVLAAERALRASENRWRALALRSSDVAFLADADAQLLFVTPSLEKHFGYSADEVVGQSGFGFHHPDDLPSVRSEWERAVALVGAPVTFRSRVRHADGRWRWIEQTVTNWISDPDIGAVIANVIDVTELVHAEQRLNAGDSTDALTGLATRRVALSELERMLGDRRAPAVVVVDIDGFREVNALYSHACGDDVLVELARRLTAAAGEGDVVARLGGDRFVVLVAAADEPDVAAVADRITHAAREPVAVAGTEVRIQVSAGAVSAPSAAAARGAAEALALADAALREAKKLGAGQVHVDDGSAHTSISEHLRTVTQLRHALHRRELVAHYQPVMDLATGRAVGAEALVRWQHPERGLLPPSEFIAAAEDSGLIVELGAQVLDQACRAAALWQQTDAFGGPFQVAVNLSARQMAQLQVVDLVRDTLAATGADARHLVLEVTESAVMDDLDTSTAVMRELRSLGVGLAVDDFGTGYSSLTYLRRFPVTAVKVDRSFVAGLTVDADDAAIVASIVQLANAIGVDCIAEGVETAEQALWLQGAACGFAQGYLWSRPVEAAELTRWLRTHTPAVPAVEAPAARRRRNAASPTGAPVTAAAVERIRQLQAEGASLHTVAAGLNAEGLLTPDGRRWHPRSIARVIAELGDVR